MKSFPLAVLAICLTITAFLQACVGQSNSNAAASSNAQNRLPVCDTVTVLGNNLMIVFQDKKNKYWFGTQNDGAYHVNGKTITHITTAHGLSSNTIRQIQEDESGNIYFTTTQGIHKFDGKTLTKLEVNQHNYSSSEWQLNPTDLWFSGIDNTHLIYRYDGKTLHPLKIPKNKLGEMQAAKLGDANYSPYDIYNIYKDSRSHIWFGTAQVGAFRYDGSSIAWISDEDATEMHEGPSNGVRSFVEDKEGDFWLSNTLAQYRVDPNNSTSSAPDEYGAREIKYTKVKGIPIVTENPSEPLIDYLDGHKDPSGNVWIVSYANGVYKYDGQKLEHFEILEDGKQIKLFSIYQDHQNQLWLGTHENGTYKFDGKAFIKFVP
jgi:ligand-binding sensor domain-containing protein